MNNHMNFCIKCGNSVNADDAFCNRCGFNLKSVVMPETKKIKPIMKISFNVAGITFDDRQEVIEKMVKKAIKEGIIEPYDGMTNKEILEYGYNVCETENVELLNLRLEPTEFEGKDAIEIYTQHLVEDKEIMVGYVPKKQVKEVLSLIEEFNTGKYKLKASANLVGGKYKYVEFDDLTYEEHIETDELEYGIEIDLSLFEK